MGKARFRLIRTTYTNVNLVLMDTDVHGTKGDLVVPGDKAWEIHQVQAENASTTVEKIDMIVRDPDGKTMFLKNSPADIAVGEFEMWPSRTNQVSMMHSGGRMILPPGWNMQFKYQSAAGGANTGVIYIWITEYDVNPANYRNEQVVFEIDDPPAPPS